MLQIEEINLFRISVTLGASYYTSPQISLLEYDSGLLILFLDFYPHKVW